MVERQFVVNAPSVVAEIIDGEVVIMNLKSGNYYSSDKMGATIWAWVEEGKTVGEIAHLAIRRCDAPPADIAGAVAAFFTRLIEEELVREAAAARPVAANCADLDQAAPPRRERFVPPELHVYRDMQDLLLLDPIHDVDDAGWPTPRADKPANPA